MKPLLQHNEPTRIAVAIGFSACLHLLIIFALHSHPVDNKTADTNRTLTVSLAQIPSVPRPPQAETKPSPQDTPNSTNNDAIEKNTKETGEDADDTYFSQGQLSLAPGMLNPALHPLPAWPSKLQGEVVFRLWIDKRGHVRRVQAMTENLTPAFIKNMHRYYLGTKFSAGLRLDEPVNSIIDITLIATQSE